MSPVQRITPFLWFDGDVEEAAKFYVSVFRDAKLESVHRPAPGKPAQSATVTLRGLKLHIFNGGPHYKLTPAASLFVDCEKQEEVDELWDEIKMKPTARDKDKIRREAIQVATMAIRFVHDLCGPKGST